MSPVYISSLISTIALLVSVAGYLLNRKMLNQNKVFDEKIKAYQEILKATNNAFNVLVRNLYDGKEVIKSKDRDREDRLDELADQIDDAIDQMNDTIIVNALVLPKHVVEQFDQFSDFFESIDVDKIFEEKLKFDKVIEILNRKFKELFDLMRNDLDSDKLNHGLQKRIRGTWAEKIMNT